ncbi:LOW QUALITY PROTEIN: hypothetical protein MKX08_006314 [Trichoderma sp. CBMAI-0020]|nr:LOW QUALITY PROTEIN: hypothetical protein MKX08_006314 [Trichoderma sp. CBMAI-0020]
MTATQATAERPAVGWLEEPLMSWLFAVVGLPGLGRREGGKEAGERRGGRWRRSQRAGRAGRMLQTPGRAPDAVDDAGDAGTLGELRGLVVKTESSMTASVQAAVGASGRGSAGVRGARPYESYSLRVLAQPANQRVCLSCRAAFHQPTSAAEPMAPGRSADPARTGESSCPSRHLGALLRAPKLEIVLSQGYQATCPC